MCDQRYPVRPPVVRLVFDFIPDDELNDTWLVARRQIGWGPMRDYYTDHARNPVSAHVEGEWLDMMSMMLGSALLHIGSRQLPNPDFGDPAYVLPEEGTSTAG